MAQGDVVFFDQFMVDAFNGVHNLSSDAIKAAIIDSNTTPAATTADPRWGAGGTTNFSSDQVTPGGNYADGGATLASFAATLDSGAAKIDCDDFSWAADGSNPTDARWIILYNDTATGKNAIGYIDIGSVFDMSGGPLSATVNAAGLALNDQA